MKNSICRILLSISTILLITLNLSAQSAAESIKFRLVREHLIVVPVQISESETLEFLLDTGTNTTVIIPEVAARLKLRAVDRIEIVTSVGSVIAPRSFVPQMTLGGRVLKNTEVLWSDLAELRRLDNRISGVLGQNVLAQFNFTIDFRERLINFSDAAESQYKHTARVDFKNEEGRILLTLETGQTSLNLVFDSGASDLILFANGCRKLKKQISSEEQMMQISTNAGNSFIQTGILRELKLGNRNLPRLSAVLNPAVDRAEDGLLPLKLFRSIYFNNQERYVILKW